MVVLAAMVAIEKIYEVRERLGLTPRELGPDRMREYFSDDYSLLSGVPSRRRFRRMLTPYESGTGAVASADSETPVLATSGLGPCVALAAYDRKQKIGFLSHNTAYTNIVELNDLLVRDMKYQVRDPLDLEFYIVGGVDGSKLADEVRDYVVDHLGANLDRIVYEDTNGKVDPYGPGRSFALDTRNGKVSCLDGVQPFKPSEVLFSPSPCLN